MISWQLLQDVYCIRGLVRSAAGNEKEVMSSNQYCYRIFTCTCMAEDFCYSLSWLFSFPGTIWHRESSSLQSQSPMCSNLKREPCRATGNKSFFNLFVFSQMTVKRTVLIIPTFLDIFTTNQSFQEQASEKLTLNEDHQKVSQYMYSKSNCGITVCVG